MGSIIILQGYLGYPVLVIPCQHPTMELPAKHVTRLVSGRKTRCWRNSFPQIQGRLYQIVRRNEKLCGALEILPLGEVQR